MSDALGGSPRFVMVGGEAGIGKTALVTTLAQAAEDQDITVHWGRTTEAADAPPFRPWRQVLRALGVVALLDPGDGVDATVDRFRRFDLIAEELADQARRHGGLVVVFEDVHRADVATLQLVIHVAEWTVSAPLCLVLTHRDRSEERTSELDTTLSTLRRIPGGRRLQLDGLPEEDIVELLGDGLSGDVVDHLVATAAGNPLAATELARHVRAGGDPRRPPGTITDGVRARLARCSEPCASLLRTAAVIGRDFSAGLAATALGWPARACLDALDEAVTYGFVEAAGEPGSFRFTHILVRDGVEATLGTAALAQAHLDVARATEAYEGTSDDVVADLARHWRRAAVLGHRDVAAAWCERAAIVADRRMAWDDAARSYDHAIDLSGADADPIDRHRLLLGSAAARLNCDDVGEAVERCCQAAAAVRDLGRSDLLAEAALLVEGRGGPPLARLRDLVVEALAGDDLDDSTRARLLGQLTVCAFYLDPGRMEDLSAASLTLAESCGDAAALVAAARARQMAMSGPEQASERLHLASVIGDAGRRLGRASVTQWETIWRIDALIELGRLPEAIAELHELRRRVDAAPLPVSRWHLARVEALVAQATGRFDDALAWGERCCDQFGQLEDPVGGRAMLAGFRVAVAMHTGFDESLVSAWDELPLSEAPTFLGDLPTLGPLVTLVGAGHFDRARTLYDRLAPVPAWTPPRFLWLHQFAMRLWAAAALGRTDDVDLIVTELSNHRGTHIGAGAGGLTYTGPVELWTGIGSLALGRLDDAVADLDHASRTCTRIGAPAFAVQAGVELVCALEARRGTGDRERAATVLTKARDAATRLGMRPWSARADELRSTPLVRTGPLSARELQVAELVARGLTNRAIAEQLYLSERTAQNHVQHILTKLDLSNRAQITAWYLSR